MAAPEPSTIKAVIWDLGGVILRTGDPGPRERWEARLGLAPGELHRLVFEGELGKLAALGQAQPAEIWESIGGLFDLSQQEIRAMETDFWISDRIDEELVGYIRDLRPAFRTALLSNAWPGVRELLEDRWEIVDAFEVLTLSYEVGLAKPDPQIYNLTLRELGLKPHETIFVDDFIRNVEGARRVGMHAVHFQSSAQAQAELDPLLGRS